MPDAVLLLAHGTPDTVEEIPEYLMRVPLTRLTLEQGRLLGEELRMPVYVGMRNWKPYIADVVAKMRADGVTRAVVICLAPQNSRTSVGLYRKAVFDAAGDALELKFVEHWAEHPELIAGFAERLAATREAFSREVGAPVPVLFTAHSVPLQTVLPEPGTDSPDPYADQARLTATLVAERVGLKPDEWWFAFQSQGMSGGPWLGPTVEDTLRELRGKGVTNLVIQPIGFLCDHVEILYDIDVAFRDFAAGLGMTIRRPESLNDSRQLTLALADLTRKELARKELA